jgi:hypothetical protein
MHGSSRTANYATATNGSQECLRQLSTFAACLSVCGGWEFCNEFIEMLRAVEYPICINCTDGLRAIADKERWYMPNMKEISKLVQELGRNGSVKVA